jgi:transcriptional regulator with XRE-family HTH domain
MLESELLQRRKDFGHWLRETRRQARITQSDLARLLNYDSSQIISNIERGVSLLPSKRLPDFARAIGCSLLEMEVRYFQCSARNTSESRMPDLLMKYLPLIEAMEFGRGSDEDILKAVNHAREHSSPPRRETKPAAATATAKADSSSGSGSASGSAPGSKAGASERVSQLQLVK